MATKASMAIFRAAEARLREEPAELRKPGETVAAETSKPVPPPAEIGSGVWGIQKLVEGGMADGTVIKRLFSMPGFSLTYVWFKANFPLPRHSHNADCLYYIISGDANLGTERLGAGDGVFVPANAVYTFGVGSEGVEFLEFRHTGDYDFRPAAASTAYWEKALQTINDNRDAWVRTVPPRPAI